MKQFHFDPMRTDPSDVARKDYLEFFVEDILAHRGDTKRLSTLQFRVKWLAYDESNNSWEPWANLREMEVLHKYLISKNLRQLVPDFNKIMKTYKIFNIKLFFKERRRGDVARIGRSPLTGPRTGYRNRAHTHPKS
jgi:Chromo (CHRromatin Organisation MOdifier) domain